MLDRLAAELGPGRQLTAVPEDEIAAALRSLWGSSHSPIVARSAARAVLPHASFCTDRADPVRPPRQSWPRPRCGWRVTDQQITWVLRPGALPPGVRTRVEDSKRASQPLQAHEIGLALSLIPGEILTPFQGQPRSHPASFLTDLAERGLAVAVTRCADDPGQATARPHPDLMFALRLTGTPHPCDPA